MLDAYKYKFGNKRAPVASLGSYSSSGGKVFALSDERDFGYPHIERLCADFGLCVSETNGDAVNGKGYSLVVECGENIQHLTPGFPSMPQLETFVDDNMVDILHNYLCTEIASS